MIMEDEIAKKINSIKNAKNFIEKQSLATKIAEKVKDGETIGFGSGSTSFLAVQAIATKVNKENLKIIAVPTSNEIAALCKYYNIKTASLNKVKLDWAFDGADEVDENKNLIKGRGAAMFKEKLNFLNSPKVYLLVDKSKFVKHLGENCLVPIECYPGAIEYVKGQLEKMNVISYKVREKDGIIASTDLNNNIIDAKFEFNKINKDLELNIKSITGVIETGLFMGFKNIEIL